MELKQIKELMTAMGRTGTKRLKLKKDNFELTIEREENIGGRLSESSFENSDETAYSSEGILNRANQTLSRSSETLSRSIASPMVAEVSKEDALSKYVTSPMVGTFYAAPSPDDSPFVKVGDRVEKNSIVCIIEAMKVMNEIKANITGTIVQILVEPGQPVEFGTKLFRINE